MAKKDKSNDEGEQRRNQILEEMFGPQKPKGGICGRCDQHPCGCGR